MGTASQALIYMAVEDLAASMSCAIFSMVPLLAGLLLSGDMKKGATACLGFTEIGCIAVYDQNHVACVVGKYGVFV